MRHRNLSIVALALFCLACGPQQCSQGQAKKEQDATGGAVDVEHSMVAKCTASPDRPLAEICKEKGIKLPLKNAKMLVYKAERALVLYEGATKLKTYAVALGGNPEGPKTVSGDSRTPEGEYFLTRKDSAGFGPSFYIGYPNGEEAEAAYSADRITKEQRNEIVKAYRTKRRPPKGTPLGDDILLHGTKDRGDHCVTGYDWTDGCVAVENAHIDELLKSIAESSKPAITILPSRPADP